MKRDFYSEQQSRASFQPKSSQPAIEPSQFGQPLPHSSSTSNSGSNWLNKASSWVANKFQTAQDFVNGSRDAISPDQVLPALRGTTSPSQSAQSQQPLVGVIDSGFGAGEHGGKMVEAIQKDNPQAQIWKGGGVGAGGWSESLIEFVDTAKASGHSRAVANLSFDLTEVHPDGSTSNRSRLTADEQSALTYARDNDVLIVASSGNQGGTMSALGQASQRSDNLIVVGAANGHDRASYSSYGNGLDLVVEVGSAGTSLAAANVTGTIAQLWSANSGLSDRQVSQILTATSTDLNKPGWDAETGFGELNPLAAIDLAQKTQPETYTFSGAQLMQQPVWKSVGGAIASARPDRFIDDKSPVSQAAPLSPKEHDEGAHHTVAVVKPNSAKPHPSASLAARLSPDDRDEGATHTVAAVKPNPAKPHPLVSQAAPLSPKKHDEGLHHTVAAVKPNPAKSHPSVSQAAPSSPEDRDAGATHTVAAVKHNSAKSHPLVSQAAPLSPKEHDEGVSPSSADDSKLRRDKWGARNKKGKFTSDPAKPPSPYKWTDTDRRAEWKKHALDPKSPLLDPQREEILRTKRGPSWVSPVAKLNNSHTGRETMELSHSGVPRRDGGTVTEPLWPTQHAAKDEYRHLPKGFHLSEPEMDQIREAYWDQPGYREYDPRKNPHQIEAGHPRLPDVETGGRFPEIPAGLKTGLKFAGEVIGRVAKPAGIALSVYEIGDAIHKDGGIGENTKEVAKEQAISWGRTAAGAGVGFAVAGPPGAVVGGVVASLAPVAVEYAPKVAEKVGSWAKSWLD